MGIQNSKSDRNHSGDDIISRKSLECVKDIITFLKEHASEEGLFRRSGRQKLRKRILIGLKKGEKTHFDNDTDTALECAAALRLYLSCLKKPVIPLRVQELILADNPGVEAQEVARDALGLIRQDINGRHGELLADILGLLRHLTLSAPPSECSELHGSPLPIALLPVFFTLTPADLIKWRQVAARFNELINEAPEQLRLDSRSESSNVQNNPLPNPEETDQWRRMQNISFLYPVITLVNNRNTYPVGENAPIFLTPLHRPPPGRLHLAISNPTG